MNPKVYSLPEEKQSAIQGNVPGVRRMSPGIYPGIYPALGYGCRCNGEGFPKAVRVLEDDLSSEES